MKFWELKGQVAEANQCKTFSSLLKSLTLNNRKQDRVSTLNIYLTFHLLAVHHPHFHHNRLPTHPSFLPEGKKRLHVHLL